jgi:hypothetical protein
MKSFVYLSLWMLIFTHGSRALAGGAIQTNLNGLPLSWEAGSTIVYNPENGALKSAGDYNAQQTRDLLKTAVDAWGILPGVQLVIEQGDFLDDGGDVDENNFKQFLGTGTEACYPDIFGESEDACLTPIIFDEDGEILDSLFGACSKFFILGFAGFDDVDDGSGDPARRIVRRGQALFSGACLNPAEAKAGCGSCQRVLSDDEILTIVTHEMGHLMGMDHSQVHPDVFAECTARPEGCPPGVADGLPTMFPILVNKARMADLHRDDEAYFQRLYGNPNQSSCSVTGKVFARDGTTEVRGVEVLAENVDETKSLTDAVSFISGAEAPKNNRSGRSQGNCRENGGFYRITGLAVGETYRLCVQKINPQFTGGSSIEPVDPPFQAFSNGCPEGLTVTCQCGSGAPCPVFEGKDILTDADPAVVEVCGAGPDNFEEFDSPSSGGCSLTKPSGSL